MVIHIAFSQGGLLGVLGPQRDKVNINLRLLDLFQCYIGDLVVWGDHPPGKNESIQGKNSLMHHSGAGGCSLVLKSLQCKCFDS